MTIGYTVTLTAAVGLAGAYFAVVKKREFWLSFLYVCVAVVNLGYLLLSMAKTVEFAIFANDVAYLGSVFLPMCMLLTIVKLCGFEVKRVHIVIGVSVGILMFAMVATTGFLPWYYKEVTLEFIDGSAKLEKLYGPLHTVYTFYLFGYFAAKIVTIFLSVRKKQIGNSKFAVFIAGIVCGNIIVWMFEKFVRWEFEFLSVTYIISELLLLLLYWMLQDYVHINDIPKFTLADQERFGTDIATMPMEIKIQKVLSFLNAGEMLAPREREILELVLQNKRRKEIADALYLSENTIKTYTRTLYGKLGVRSREELYSLLLK